MTRRQKVLKELVDAYNGKKYQYDHKNWISGGWVPIGAIVNPYTGGSSGTRRLRELRAGGIKIEHRYYYKTIPGALASEKVKTETTIYRLLTPPDKIDQENCRLKNNVTSDPKQMTFIDTYKL